MNNKSLNLFEENYFKDRHEGKDPKREEMYLLEYNKINSYISQGKVLDMGCGMGNFLQIFDDDQWDRYGFEISEYAASKAKEKGIEIIDYDYPDSFFDLVILRGVFQHLDKPLYTLQECIRMLKKKGYMIFLATPNINSLMYRLFKELPMLDPERNFVLPSDIMLKQILINFDLKILKIEYPYLKTPYSQPLIDHLKFMLRFFGIKKKFAFWRNMMEIYATKNNMTQV